MGKVLSCYWKISINGKELNNARRKCISNIQLEDSCDYSDTCTFKVSDPNFLYIEDNIFLEEATVSVEIGWHEDTHRIKFDGYISAIDIDFPEDGCPVLSIYCLDGSHVMNRKKKKRSWDNVTRADVVKKIAKEYGFKCVVESGYTFDKEDTISQSDATDIEFCESLAGQERVPFMCKLIGKTLYFVKKGITKDPSSTMYYKKYPYDIISFKPRINKETILEEASASDINTKDKSVDSHISNNDNTSRDIQGEPVNPSGGVVYDPKTDTWT